MRCHLLGVGAVHVFPLVQDRGLDGGGFDAGRAASVEERQVAQRTKERCLAGASFAHDEQASTAPLDRFLGFEQGSPNGLD